MIRKERRNVLRLLPAARLLRQHVVTEALAILDEIKGILHGSLASHVLLEALHLFGLQTLGSRAFVPIPWELPEGPV